MGNIKVVTDSTAYIQKDFVIKENIEIVQLSVNFNNKTVKEGFPGEFNDFFKSLNSLKEIPTTSQPSIGDFIKVFKQAIEEDYEVITILISSKLSGTYKSAYMAAQMINDNMISIIDSETSASNLRFLVELAINLIKKGLAREKIVEIINKEKKQMGIRLTVETLEYLRKGGRLTGIQAFLGNVLNIKPIIGLVEGELRSLNKVRGKKKAIKLMISEIPKGVNKISIAHILNMEEAISVKQMLEERFSNTIITIDEIGPVVGAHLGPKTIGILYKW